MAARRAPVKINPVTGAMEKASTLPEGARRDGCLVLPDSLINAAKEAGIGGGVGTSPPPHPSPLPPPTPTHPHLQHERGAVCARGEEEESRLRAQGCIRT
jgi:hypothetical protein